MREGKAAPSVLLVIPVYNHARTLRRVVESALGEGFAVLVVDDGSTDRPLETLKDLEVHTHRLEPNQGKGAALLAAAGIAEGLGFEAILTLDADGQHDPREAQRLVAAASDWPCLVLGTRAMEGPEVPGSSRFGRSFSNFWVRLESGLKLQDTQSGYRLYPVALLRSSRFLTRRYTFEIEALVRGAWAGLPVLEVPISVSYRDRITHFRMFKDNLRLTGLHTFLVARSILGRPTRKLRKPRPTVGLWETLRNPLGLLRRLATEHASPMELATAIGLGVFLGALPIIPFGIALILYVHHRLHLNKLAGVAASNVCVAPFVPFLCIQVGYFMRQGRWWTDYSRHSLLNEIPLRLLEWALGSLVVGPLLGLALAVPSYFIVKAWRR